MGYFGSFITGRLQREIVEDCIVKSDSYLKVGQLCKLDSSGILAPCTDADEKAAKESATHMIAQSDMTMEYGHVPVENRDYRYFPNVAGTVTNATTGAVIDPANLLGVYETVSKLPAAASDNNGKFALVLADGKTYSSDGSAWSVDATKKISYKKVALFKLFNKDDVVVRSNG